MKKFLAYVLTGLILTGIFIIIYEGGVSTFLIFLKHANMLFVVSLWALGFAIASFLFSIISKDHSWIDRIYSILPVGFAWFYAYRSGFALAPCIGAALVSFWGIRLTFNFARRGGYTGMEDYRWPILRQKIRNPVLWQLFSLFFISLYQSGLFVLFTYPLYRMVFVTAGSLPILFWIFSVLGIIFVCIEFTADQQQWNFQAAKKAASEKRNYLPKYADDIKKGFLTHGLFGLCRHPNYFGELSFWWTIWLIALALTWDPIGSGLIGPILLTAMMTGSTILAESISSKKYPEYRNYQKKVISPIVPWFSKRG